MAGHSKWANIRHRKAAQDAKRGKIFTKLIRELTVAAREGGSDPDSNPRLRLAIDKALGANMTRDTIERNVKRGAGELEGQVVEDVTYEGYGPGGTAILVECMTDNIKRTVQGVRHAFNKSGGNLGTDGSVAYLFDKKGLIIYSEEHNEDEIMDAALEAGAEDVITREDGHIHVLTEPGEFFAVNQALEAAGLTSQEAEVTLIPQTKAELDADTAAKFMRLVDALEELDDVQEVHSNAEISEAVAASLSE
ncbi:YebC/PmpR family DNA-binding transcriptional regulator [Thalassomonas viridans]|uniref:Probable transcriptional regulatory protein SG34_010225 n=1 Tax=Thalassomonas viridans TaxID=137584 RepID=A0AAF0CAT4_9GAMM|nr:YebC/PmpR family DNA-binding transcriptional regulator [Thalassomonas viridans]WDE07228.1 YebC/PmpR family DNA-binding transcriptional regulator [Thalassomonas viridans]